MTVPRSTHFYLLLSLAVALDGLVLHAQEPAAPQAAAAPAAAAPKPAEKARRVDKPTPTPAASAAAPTPAAPTPAPKKRGFFSRLFGPRATPSPTPVQYRIVTRVKPKKVDDDDATKKPTIKPGEKAPEKPAGKPVAASTEKPKTDDGDGPTKKPVATPALKSRRVPDLKDMGRAPDRDASKEQRALAEANKSGDPDAIEKAQYDYARARAMGDEHIRDLKAKADAALSEEEGRASLRAYNKALFEKMRTLEPAIGERIDHMQAAMMKKLGGDE